MSRKFWVVLTAAGASERMGLGTPKVLLEILGVPILSRALRLFTSLPLVADGPKLSGLVVTVPSSFREQCDQVVALEQARLKSDGLVAIADKIFCTEGGASRQESVCKALELIAQQSDVDGENQLVLIHDAARALCPPEVVLRVLDALSLYPGVAPALPVTDSLKSVSLESSQESFASSDGVASELVRGSVDRSSLRAVQTPQGFHFPLIYKLHLEHKGSQISFTDDTSLLEGRADVLLIRGAKENIKITTPEDIELAEFLLSRG